MVLNRKFSIFCHIAQLVQTFLIVLVRGELNSPFGKSSVYPLKRTVMSQVVLCSSHRDYWDGVKRRCHILSGAQKIKVDFYFFSVLHKVTMAPPLRDIIIPRAVLSFCLGKVCLTRSPRDPRSVSYLDHPLSPRPRPRLFIPFITLVTYPRPTPSFLIIPTSHALKPLVDTLALL